MLEVVAYTCNLSAWEERGRSLGLSFGPFAFGHSFSQSIKSHSSPTKQSYPKALVTALYLVSGRRRLAINGSFITRKGGSYLYF